MPAPITLDSEKARARALRGLRIYFAQRRWPRVMMAAVVATAGGAGFLASYGLLHAGMKTMWLRYPLAVLAAWLAFLALMWLWAQWERRYFLPDHELDKVLGSDPGEREEMRVGETARDWLDWVDLPGSGDAEGCFATVLIVALLVLLLGAVLSVAGVIAAAPALIAEVFLDAMLSAALYKRMRGIEDRWWLGGAVRQTWGPVTTAAVFVALLGFAIAYAKPGSDSLGDYWRPALPAELERR